MSPYQRHRDEIAALLDPDCYTIEWLDGEIAAGLMQVFGNDRAVIVTEVKNYPAGAQVLHGMVAAGDMAAILDLIEQAEAWGRSMGCTAAEIASREGWARVMAGRGYEMFQTTIRKGL